jgi:hypothetical protein
MGCFTLIYGLFRIRTANKVSERESYDKLLSQVFAPRKKCRRSEATIAHQIFRMIRRRIRLAIYRHYTYVAKHKHQRVSRLTPRMIYSEYAYPQGTVYELQYFYTSHMVLPYVYWYVEMGFWLVCYNDFSVCEGGSHPYTRAARRLHHPLSSVLVTST